MTFTLLIVHQKPCAQECIRLFQYTQSENKKLCRSVCIIINILYFSSGAHNNHGNGNLPNGRIPSRQSQHPQHAPPPPPSTSPPADGTSNQPPPTHPKPTRDSGISSARHEAQLARRRQEEAKQMTKQRQKSALMEFVKVLGLESREKKI